MPWHLLDHLPYTFYQIYIIKSTLSFHKVILFEPVVRPFISIKEATDKYILPSESIKLFLWYSSQQVTSYELFLLHELRVTFCLRVTSYCLLHELRVTFYIRVTSYFYYTSYKLLFIARVTSYFLHKSYELLITAQVTS